MDLLKRFGDRLKDLREEKKLSINELGRIIGVSGAAISRWENYLREPKLSNLYALSKFFNCSIDYLVGKEF